MKTHTPYPSRAPRRQTGRSWLVARTLFLTLTLLAAPPAWAQASPTAMQDLRTRHNASAPTVERSTAGTRTAAATSSLDPRITITANRDTTIAGLENLTWTATREAPLDEALTVTVRLTQEQNWLSNRSRRVTFAANKATANLLIVANSFSSSVTESGNLTATVDSVSGYDTGDATATVYMVSQDGPAMKVFLSQEDYRFAEDAAAPFVTLVARAAAGMPRGATVAASLISRGGTATSPGDYEVFSEEIAVSEGDFTLEDGRWSAQARLPVTLVDDEVREGAESFTLLLDRTPGKPFELQLSDPGGSECPNGGCLGSVEITDDEDIPEWELSVNPESIMEEDESSSTATLSITNGKSFAADQAVTFAFAGTATEGVDYLVTPADASAETLDHQVVLAAGSTSLDVTFTAVNDDFEDSNEEIEISVTHGGEAIGNTRTIRILNQEVLPKITLAVERDTIIAGLEDLLLTAIREAPLDAPIAVTLQLTQDQEWLSRTSYQLNFAAQGSTANLVLPTSLFSSEVTESGNLTATVDTVRGYDTGDATATAFVVSQIGPAVRVSFSDASYTFAEDSDDASVTVVAWTAPGMPRGATVTFSVVSGSMTATSGDDYQPLSEEITVQEQDFGLVAGRWVEQVRLPVSLLDDESYEDTESFNLLLQPGPGHPSELLLLNNGGPDCQDPPCPHPVHITDDGDIPEFDVSLSADEIMEEGETSSTATLAITNGKTLATDQMLTFQLRGDAIPGHDYRVTPADPDEGVAGHQVTLAAGSNSVDVTFTAMDDEREEPTEKIRLSVTYEDVAIGSGTIHIIDRFPGPRVEITFEGVDPPRDEYTAGVATGPFTARFTFSEQVEDFTREDIDWQTHAGTTVDSTNIEGLAWDYREVRAGLEYSIKVMPEQNGRLWAAVRPGAATSVATGDGNQLGANSLWIDLPPNRMMVAPTELAVVEEDPDGASFLVVLTSEPSDTVTVALSGTAGTALTATSVAGLTFAGVFWTVGRVVTVRAGSDANTADETVTLRLAASGGGYGGQTVNVVVSVRDNGAASDQGMSEEEALALVDDVTPEAAAAALFGEADLGDAQLDALDLLGNGNGDYDLGDLLSWTERCRRGEATCGSGSSPDFKSVPGAGAGLLGLAVPRRSGRTGGRGRRGSGETRGSIRNRRVRRRSGRASFGLALLLAATMTWGCADDVMQTAIAEADPGYLTVELTVPAGVDDMAAILLVEGPGIESVRATGFELFQSDPSSHTRRQVIVSGALSAGPILEFHVPDRGDLAEYTVRLRQVAGEDYTLRDLSRYTAAISR